VILDEAQMVKNYQSKAYGLVRQLKSNSKIALSGTPMENNLMELWSIFSIVAPGLFPEPKAFQQLYRNPIEKSQDKEALARLRSRIKPFILRRKKELVEKQLPQKIEQTLFVDLNPEHRKLYDIQLQYERQRVLGLIETGGLKEHRFEILRSLMKMRQMCLLPNLVDKKHPLHIATKLDILTDSLSEILAGNHRVLIFSQFTSFLSEVKNSLTKQKTPFLYLDGSTKNRGDLIKRFQTDQSVSVFLISLKAGGFGLNLTSADYCILLDPWWNPAVERQAIDRTHRIGQTKSVVVYRLIAKETIEEKVLALQQKKQKLFQNILEDENIFGPVVTEEDIKGLFLN
jgi:SNF2 family DNA or RNA helicase